MVTLSDWNNQYLSKCCPYFPELVFFLRNSEMSFCNESHLWANNKSIFLNIIPLLLGVSLMGFPFRYVIIIIQLSPNWKETSSCTFITVNSPYKRFNFVKSTFISPSTSLIEMTLRIGTFLLKIKNFSFL